MMRADVPRLRAFIGHHLRTIADRIDYAGAPKGSHITFTFEERTGIVFRDDGRGCRVWHLSDADYEKAHTEAGPIASGNAEAWLPRRAPEGTPLTGLHREPEWNPAGPAFTVTLFARKGGTDG
jgi:hypothetical protein